MARPGLRTQPLDIAGESGPLPGLVADADDAEPPVRHRVGQAELELRVAVLVHLLHEGSTHDLDGRLWRDLPIAVGT